MQRTTFCRLFCPKCVSDSVIDVLACSTIFQIANSGNVRLANMELVHEGVMLPCEHPSFFYPADDAYECKGVLTLGWADIEAGAFNTSAT